MDVKILRVSSALVLRWRLSRRSEVSSVSDLFGWGGTTSSFGLGCKGFAGFAGFFHLVTGACLWPTMALGADFTVLRFLLVFVTSPRVGVPVTT